MEGVLGLVKATERLPVTIFSAPEHGQAREMGLHVVLHHGLICRIAARQGNAA